MTQKSYIDENGEALELDSAWFSRAERGFPLKPPKNSTAQTHETARGAVSAGSKALPR